MQSVQDLNNWLISKGRLLGRETEIVAQYCAGLVALGVPLSRVRIAQRYTNPLIGAWGLIWTPGGTRRYTVPTGVTATSSWQGSPFEHVVRTKTSLRKRLMDLDLTDEHATYLDLANEGMTDFLAMPMEYGDGSIQGTSFCTDHQAGFTEENLHTIEATGNALASALEPIAMRACQESLLQTYLGNGPAREIGNGHYRRGEHRGVSAAILFADLRGFTAKSESWPEPELLRMMGDFFEMIVTPIHDQGGDVLKFMGDGVLAIFEDKAGPTTTCNAAVSAARQALERLQDYNEAARRNDRAPIEFVIGIDFGTVTFGNIGSPDRLDFTVVGPAVNVASRVQELCKKLDEHILLSANVAAHIGVAAASIGRHPIRGLEQGIEIFRVARA